jgi:hypothetical protein
MYCPTLQFTGRAQKAAQAKDFERLSGKEK